MAAPAESDDAWLMALEKDANRDMQRSQSHSSLVEALQSLKADLTGTAKQHQARSRVGAVPQPKPKRSHSGQETGSSLKLEVSSVY